MVAIGNWGNRALQPLLALGQDSRLPVMVSLLLILLLAQSLAHFTWQVIPTPPNDLATHAISPGVTQEQASNRPAPAINIAPLHLFGMVQEAKPKVQPSPQVAPDTRLNLKLSGVFASSQTELARAIIADGSGKQKTYAVGAVLPGNATLREIYADRVILESHGRLETLRLPEKRTSSGFATQASRSESPANIRASADRLAAVNTAGAAPEALLAEFQQALINNPESLMNLVQAVPITDTEGQFKGYRLLPGRDRSLLSKFGLRSGDILTAVNGVTLDNPLKGLEIMQQLTAATSVTITIERDGQPQSLSFDLQ